MLFYMLLISTVAVADTGKSNNKTGVTWQHWTKAIFVQAKREKRLVLLSISADWCTYCKKMDATTYVDTHVLASIKKHYIPVRIKYEENPELADSLAKNSFPVTVVFNPDEEEIIRRGYLEPQLMTWLLDAVSDEYLMTQM